MRASTSRPSVLKMAFTCLYVCLFPALLLWLSGDWFWLQGWIFGGWFVGMSLFVIGYLYIKDPALLQERYKAPGQGAQKSWDVYVVLGLMIGFMGWIIIMPLDAKRFAWTTPFPLAVQLLAGLMLLASFFFFFRAYAENTFLSPLVRIQAERKQTVITTGVYSIVRHPMYFGGVLLFLGAPLLLSSAYGLLIGGILSVLIAWRSVGEEQMLKEELAGYEAYQQRVRYRLIPFIW